MSNVVTIKGEDGEVGPHLTMWGWSCKDSFCGVVGTKLDPSGYQRDRAESIGSCQ